MARSAACSVAAAAVLGTTTAAHAQPQQPASGASATTLPSPSASIEALLTEVRHLRESVNQLQGELDASRARTDALEAALQAMQQQGAEQTELVNGQTSTLEQTKVESSSKYRVRLSGLALFQIASTRGTVDNMDLPLLAMESAAGDSGGNLSGAVRQSSFGMDVFGPVLGDFATRANMRLDFFGGFPAANDGLSAPGLRLRTIELALDRQNTSVRVGQEAPFFSPLSPSSLASSAYPALASAGNIWSWTPQAYVEQRFGARSGTTISVRGGVLDALTGELPAGEYSRLPTAGERSRTPATAFRVALERGPDDSRTSVGAGAFYSRQDWAFNRHVNAWAATGDAQWAARPNVHVSGEVYRGQAIGGLGGGAHSSVLFDGPPDDPTAGVHPLVSSGGWGQLSVRHGATTEFNVAAGIDRSRPRTRATLLQQPSDEAPSAQRNAAALFNVIMRPRSNLLFSVEYRRLCTTRFDGRAWLADHLNVSTGIVF